MSRILTEVLEASGKYAANLGEKGKLPLPPARSFAILLAWTPARSREIRASLRETRMHAKCWRAGGRRFANQAPIVIDDVERIRNHPLVPKSIPIYGFV